MQNYKMDGTIDVSEGEGWGQIHGEGSILGGGEKKQITGTWERG